MGGSWSGLVLSCLAIQFNVAGAPTNWFTGQVAENMPSLT